MEALVEEIQPDNPPKITGDAGPETACSVVGMPSGELGALPVPAIGKSKKCLQVSGVACLVQRIAAMSVEQNIDEQELKQAVIASHLQREEAVKVENLAAGHEQVGRTWEGNLGQTHTLLQGCMDSRIKNTQTRKDRTCCLGDTVVQKA